MTGYGGLFKYYYLNGSPRVRFLLGLLVEALCQTCHASASSYMSSRPSYPRILFTTERVRLMIDVGQLQAAACHVARYGLGERIKFLTADFRFFLGRASWVIWVSRHFFDRGGCVRPNCSSHECRWAVQLFSGRVWRAMWVAWTVTLFNARFLHFCVNLQNFFSRASPQKFFRAHRLKGVLSEKRAGKGPSSFSPFSSSGLAGTQTEVHNFQVFYDCCPFGIVLTTAPRIFLVFN